MRLPCLVLLGCLLSPSGVSALEPVRAEIAVETAWTGQAVPLIITLYSPGPFSGTASFDLPDLPRTAFVTSGSPLVGSEEVDGQSCITQRHELTVYTQRSGEIVIPPFRVRFAGKQTFTSDPEPMEGSTPELRFESRRPPGTESIRVLVCATSMEIRQTWDPQPSAAIQVGDLIVRTVGRMAKGTTAMMLPELSDNSPEGTAVYLGSPDVQDQIERGDARAERIDVVKYQFRRGGVFVLPELTFVWWDPQEEELQRTTLPGLEVKVAQPSGTAEPSGAPLADWLSAWPWITGGMLAAGLLAPLAWRLAARLVVAWRAHYNRPEAVAARALRSACATNDAPAAYAAMLAWRANQRLADGCGDAETPPATDRQGSLDSEWRALTRSLFAQNATAANWNGQPLWTAFSVSQRHHARQVRVTRPSPLPALNPMSSAGYSILRGT